MRVCFIQPVSGSRRKHIGRGASFQEALASLQIFDQNCLGIAVVQYLSDFGQ